MFPMTNLDHLELHLDCHDHFVALVSCCIDGHASDQFPLPPVSLVVVMGQDQFVFLHQLVLGGIST